MRRIRSGILKFRIFLFFPVGTGAYGDFVRNALAERGIVSPVPKPETENGCCYCFVEDDGERTFACYHGAEYRFQKEWFDALDASEIDSVYICGLEIEEETGTNILSYLEEHPEFTVFFAPGPRITLLDPSGWNGFLPASHSSSESAGDHFLYRKRGAEGGSRGNPSVYAKYGDRYSGSRRLLLL